MCSVLLIFIYIVLFILNIIILLYRYILIISVNIWLSHYYINAKISNICPMRYFTGTDLMNIKTCRCNLTIYPTSFWSWEKKCLLMSQLKMKLTKSLLKWQVVFYHKMIIEDVNHTRSIHMWAMHWRKREDRENFYNYFTLPQSFLNKF